MREREFWELLEEVFGRTYGRSLSRDQRMSKLANMTVVEALDAGGGATRGLECALRPNGGSGLQALGPRS